MPELTTQVTEEVTVDVEVEFDVYCGACGAGLCGNTTTDSNKMRVTVDPCEKCLEAAKYQGYDQGIQEAEKT